MRAKLLKSTIALLSVGLLVAGCGSSGDSTTVTTSSLSKQAFTKKANAICERNRNEIVAATGEIPEAIEVAYVPAFESLVEEIRELGAPKGSEAEVEAFLTAMEEDTQTLEEKQGSLSTFQEVEKQFKGSAAAAKKAGLSRCTFYAYFPSAS